MKLYAISLVAVRTQSSIILQGCNAAAVLAHNEDEANGMAWSMCRELFPVNAGWNSHAHKVVCVPFNMIEKVTE